MVFSSPIFLYWFLPAFLLLYYASPRTWKSLTLTLASYVFYGWWRPDFVILMLISTVVDFGCGRAIAAAQQRGSMGRGWLVLSVLVNLGLLGYFKYANFGVETFNGLLEAWGLAPVAWSAVILPVGISFYTFQTMSYTIDVYRKVAQPQRRLVDFMSYVAMFPQLVAGPIVRYNTIADQLVSREHTQAKFYQGVLAFQCGLAKKVLIADPLGGLANHAFAADALSAGDGWLGLLAYTLQIYFDFSGYSDMAIGLGLMLGFRFPINFDSPYKSIGITDFWRRWHVSLSTWLRDYLYVPLGGNRKGPIRTYFNLVTVMVIGGLWHGANWTFLAWGAYQGLWLILERLVGRRAFYAWAPRPLQVGLTFVIVMIGWVFFKASDLPAAIDYLGFLVGVGGENVSPLRIGQLSILALVVGTLIAWFMPNSQRLLGRAPRWWVLLLQFLFLIALLQLHFHDHVPFLYYQF